MFAGQKVLGVLEAVWLNLCYSAVGLGKGQLMVSP